MKTFATTLSNWDGESVIVRHDRPTGAMIFIAIHSTILGPATGGTRMRQYAEHSLALDDALKLAEGMTRKFAVADFPRGGGKAVISIQRDLSPDERAGLLQRYGEIIGQLGGYFYTGPDIGTTSDDMDLIAQHGAPFVHSCTPAAGGAGSSGSATALGVFTGIKVMCEHLFGDNSLDKRTVLVQGVGSVGSVLIEHLLRANAEVLFTDVNEQLTERFSNRPNLGFVTADKALETECDILAPCAIGGLLNEHSIPRLRCRAIVGGANNQLATPDDAERLRQRNIVYAPDYVVNFGGAMAITGIEALGWAPSDAEQQVITRVSAALARILKVAAESDVTTDETARQQAEARLAEPNNHTAQTSLT